MEGDEGMNSDFRVSQKFIEGERLCLRPLVEEDADGPYPAWLNDSEVCKGNSHGVYPYSRTQAIEYIQYAATASDELILAVDLKDGGRHIGNIALQRIHKIYRSAEFSILLGDRNEWGKGYGLEAGRLLLNHGFSELNLNRIACATFETNIGMRKLALALGMKQEGVRAQAAFKDGKYLDIIEFGVLMKDYCNQFDAVS